MPVRGLSFSSSGIKVCKFLQIFLNKEAVMDYKNSFFFILFLSFFLGYINTLFACNDSDQCEYWGMDLKVFPPEPICHDYGHVKQGTCSYMAFKGCVCNKKK